MPRPKKSPEEKRDLRVAFRLSAPDAEALGTRAKAAGLSVGAYARHMALRGKLEVVTRQEPDFALLDQLRRIGVNLNQLAREPSPARRPRSRLSPRALRAHREPDRPGHGRGAGQ